MDSGFSRVPIYEETPDRIIGVLYIKDVLPHLYKRTLAGAPCYAMQGNVKGAGAG